MDLKLCIVMLVGTVEIATWNGVGVSTHPLDPTQPANPTKIDPPVINPKNRLQQFSPLKLASIDLTMKLIKI